MSLRWRILGSTVFLVLFAVLASVAVGYFATQFRLDVLVERIGGDEAVQLADRLSREYTAVGGWQTLEQVLFEEGYGNVPSDEGSGHEDGPEGSGELFHRDPIRVVVTDAGGGVVLDNRALFPPGTVPADIGGHREAVLDLAANRIVGAVHLDVNQENLATESHGFLSALLYIALIGGAITAGVAILLAAWLSKRITAPVTALTRATQAIAGGESSRLPVTSTDELGRMSAAFNRMSESLETQRELRRQLIDDVSHELNSPLSVIKLEARALGDGLQPAQSASRNIIEEVDRLSGLVSDLDWLAETDRGEFRLSREQTPVHELLRAEVDRWQPLSRARGVDLSLAADEDAAVLDVDRLRMGQALGNILGNAIKCTDSGGSVRVAVTTGPSRMVAISVADTGIGLAADDLERIFDRFYRTPRSRDRGLGGKGLGLSIARAIVEAHGGAIKAESAGPGSGSTVIITLPAAG